MSECERCAMLQQQVADRDRFIELDQAEIKRRGIEIERLRDALEIIARGVWTAPNSVETMVYTARRALKGAMSAPSGSEPT